MIRHRFLAALALVLALAGGAWAVDLLRYNLMAAAPSVSATIPGGQSGTWTTPLDPQSTNGGDPTINVTPLFSAASATATSVEVGLYQKTGNTYTFCKLVNLGTLTAQASDYAAIGSGSWALGEGFGLDTRGATHYDIRVRGTISSGNMAFLRWTHGASGSPR